MSSLLEKLLAVYSNNISRNFVETICTDHQGEQTYYRSWSHERAEMDSQYDAPYAL